ncbi:hypothetical protein GF420_15675 [candidate division GN15 bacterium]|nr:hypothetical protein [candidate division GN15 bacterium]
MKTHTNRILELIRDIKFTQWVQFDHELIRLLKKEETSLEPIVWDSLKELAHHESTYLKEALSTRKDLPVETMKLLAEEKWGIRVTLAVNPNLPEELMDTLSRDRQYFVRGALASNPSIPQRLMRVFSQDVDWVRGLLATNTSIPRGLMELLAEDQTLFVRDLLAKNPALPEDMMERMALAFHPSVREALAENPNCPEHLK